MALNQNYKGKHVRATAVTKAHPRPNKGKPIAPKARVPGFEAPARQAAKSPRGGAVKGMKHGKAPRGGRR